MIIMRWLNAVNCVRSEANNKTKQNQQQRIDAIFLSAVKREQQNDIKLECNLIQIAHRMNQRIKVCVGIRVCCVNIFISSFWLLSAFFHWNEMIFFAIIFYRLSCSYRCDFYSILFFYGKMWLVCWWWAERNRKRGKLDWLSTNWLRSFWFRSDNKNWK